MITRLPTPADRYDADNEREFRRIVELMLGQVADVVEETTSAPAVYAGYGSPENVVAALPGSMYVQRDAATGVHPVWVKLTGAGTATGWRAMGGFAGTSGISSPIQIGNGSSSTNTSAIAIGFNATTAGLQAVAIGGSSAAPASVSVAIGYNASVNSTATGAVRIGSGGGVTAADGIAIGYTTNVLGIASIAIGGTATVSHDYAIGIGYGATTFGNNTCAIGGSGAGAGITEICIGRGNTNATPNAVAIRLTNGLGTNIAAGALTLIAGRSTGNAAQPGIIFQTGATGGASGSTLAAATTRLTINASGVIDIAAGGTLAIAGTQILGPRIAGWGTPTGTATRTTFDTTTVTLAQLAERVYALIADAKTHGFLGT